MAFKQRLAEHVSQRTGEALSKATLYATLNALRSFFQWLAWQPEFKSRLNYADAEYFNLSAKEARIATAHRERPVPTPEQIEHVVRAMPGNSEIERRNRAIIAFAILTGARDGAIASLKLKHIDIVTGVVEQDAREVKTKASKTITTNFYPVPDIFRQVVVDWVAFLRADKLWGHNDPLFPNESLGLLAQVKLLRLRQSSSSASISFESLHPSIAARCQSLFAAGSYDNAVFEAFRTVEDTVRTRTGSAATDVGVALISKVMSSKAPQLRFSDIAPEREGYHALFRGAIAAFKNPASHRTVGHSDSVRVLELLAFASLLLRLIDDTESHT